MIQPMPYTFTDLGLRNSFSNGTSGVDRSLSNKTVSPGHTPPPPQEGTWYQRQPTPERTWD